jgi:alkanesulfonate monooxygenase SsuD/methylene tetrahydromethanopterin reductase-like flavin-dependent oxidoreductase (luciferase family)
VTTPVSLTLPHFDRTPQAFLDLCRQVPELGIAGVFGFDHLVPLGDPRRPVLEAATVLGAAAAAMPAPGRIGSLVLRTSIRPPAVTAGVAASLAAIAGSRAMIGLGVGDRFSLDEARRYGMPPASLEERLAGLEETIALIRLLAPEIPVWVGGLHRRVREVAARKADGWNAWQVSGDELAARVSEARESAPGPLVVTWGGGVILAKNQASLEEAVARRGGSNAVMGDGLIAGTPGQVAHELRARAELVDELVVSVLPNEARNWRLFATAVMPGLVR